MNSAQPIRSLTRVALVGNPNTGKTSLFNALTGLNQKVGNFPGVTVDKKSGRFTVSLSPAEKPRQIEITDLPGTYSLFPKSPDERITTTILSNPGDPDYPDLILLIADATQLRRSLLLCTQVTDLGIPVVLALNMSDLAVKKGIEIREDALSSRLGIPVVKINARSQEGLDRLKEVVALTDRPAMKPFMPDLPSQKNGFTALVAREGAESIKAKADADAKGASDDKKANTLDRYRAIDALLVHAMQQKAPQKKNLTETLDQWLTHRIWGYVIFMGMLLLIFQAIFAWARIPMDGIEWAMAALSAWLRALLPAHFLTGLLLDGIMAGLGGIVVFIPQIALLFAFIGLLEDSGYMARVSFIMDRLMRSLGLSGRSVIPLIGGMACAIPAIMSTRTIGNWKERLITIMVIPLTTCSARLPVYTLLISLVIPAHASLGPFGYQGLVFMGLYLLGFGSALAAAWLLKFMVRERQKGHFIMELPDYRSPRWSNIAITVVEKVRIFVWDAGKVILGISILLWILASFGPAGTDSPSSEKSRNREYKPIAIEESWVGIWGKKMEPVLEPVGFDWKIGIALITSFAAREVFVGTMATLYSVGDEGDVRSLKNKMLEEKDPRTGKPRYTLAVGLSLLVFYAFAMQCVSTMAIVYRETKSFKWPLIQFTFLGILAYIASLITYHIFS